MLIRVHSSGKNSKQFGDVVKPCSSGGSRIWVWGAEVIILYRRDFMAYSPTAATLHLSTEIEAAKTESRLLQPLPWTVVLVYELCKLYMSSGITLPCVSVVWTLEEWDFFTFSEPFACNGNSWAKEKYLFLELGLYLGRCHVLDRRGKDDLTGNSFPFVFLSVET
ncbi:hypothetical protein AVEN_23077-1 [Araneus ventricosus]|uniref:Uncharacterized protein n=1 Tax=Araneus ventricosus TaxID=182803 RepID=A0A4Y2JDR0_ARAVE|nr:hypothetical protein AVEN_23077-1 [Araneus ventricosus]